MNVKEELKMRKWAEDMVDQQQSGLTQLQWCNLHGIKIKTFAYRCHRVREVMQKTVDEGIEINQLEKTQSTPPVLVSAADSLPDIAEIKVDNNNTASEGITITLDNMMVNISPTSNTEHVKLLMKVLSDAKRY